MATINTVIKIIGLSRHTAKAPSDLSAPLFQVVHRLIF